jgi:hypothetical protein
MELWGQRLSKWQVFVLVSISLVLGASSLFLSLFLYKKTSLGLYVSEVLSPKDADIASALNDTSMCRVPGQKSGQVYFVSCGGIY